MSTVTKPAMQSGEDVCLSVQAIGVPFIIVRPRHGGHRIVARGNDVSFSLIAAAGALEQFPIPRPLGMITFFLLLRPMRSDQVNRVETSLFLPYDSADSREIMLQLCWKGRCDQSDRQFVQRMFDIRCRAIEQALRVQSVADLEVEMAPVLAYCEECDQASQDRLARMKIVFYIYAVAAAVIVFNLLSRYIDRIVFKW